MQPSVPVVSWLFQLHETHPAAQAIGIFALVCVAGMAIGSVKVRGIGLGTAGVLFAGLITGHFSKPVDHATLDFVKEFGLLLFVFTIASAGAGFFAALRRDGLRLNAVAGDRSLARRSAVLSDARSAWIGPRCSHPVWRHHEHAVAWRGAANAGGIARHVRSRQALPALRMPSRIRGDRRNHREPARVEGNLRIDPAKEAAALRGGAAAPMSRRSKRTHVVKIQSRRRGRRAGNRRTRTCWAGRSANSPDATRGVVVSRLTRADVGLTAAPD
jgi:hypothetical protein